MLLDGFKVAVET